MIFTADFETTTQKDDCRVWAYALCEVGNTDNFLWGNSIDDLIEWCENYDQPLTLYFHNLKFDGEFILNWLFRNGYKLIKDSEDKQPRTFSTLISDHGEFYSIEIYFYQKGKRWKKVKILDSLKVLPLSVAAIAKAFKLPIIKLEIDYTEYREIGHELTEQEIAYIKNDVTIVALALEILFKQNLKKMTTGANALNEYKEIVGKKTFERLYPKPFYDSDIRQSYRGGFTYLNPKYKEKDIGEGIVLDVNSLYPSVMYYNELPYGEGIFFEGKYEEDNNYNLYVQMLSCQFRLKENHIPTIQLKNNLSFNPVEYLTSSGGDIITMCMTSVDLKLFFDQYDVWDIEYYSGWKFRSKKGMFKDYIDKWNSVKVEATKEGNGALRTIAKLMLNSLYGKFATNPVGRSKYPYLGDDGIVHYAVGLEEDREPVYIPMGAFITAWARNKTIRSAQAVYDRFVYADTDSLHLIGTEEPKGLDISPIDLGAWKHESTFTRARFLRQKSYIEEIDGVLKITCAGMPSSCHKYVTWDNFHTGNEFPGKLKITHTPGGIVLQESPHTLRE
jgi:DNA polymerase elongation subunit (family B)